MGSKELRVRETWQDYGGANAGFNIAELHQLSISQFNKESDLLEGNTDIPKEAMVLKSN